MMSRARPALIATIALIAVCGFSLILFIGLDTALHVKIPYAVVSSFFLTAILMFWTIRIAFRGGEAPTETAQDSGVPEFSGESRSPNTHSVPVNSAALVIAAPLEGIGAQGPSGAAPKVAPRVALRGVILFSSPNGNSGREAV